MLNLKFLSYGNFGSVKSLMSRYAGLLTLRRKQVPPQERDYAGTSRKKMKICCGGWIRTNDLLVMHTNYDFHRPNI